MAAGPIVPTLGRFRAPWRLSADVGSTLGALAFAAGSVAKGVPALRSLLSWPASLRRISVFFSEARTVTPNHSSSGRKKAARVARLGTRVHS